MTDVTNNSVSAFSDLHALIQKYNPFDRSLAVRTHDVWEQKFPDVPSINGHISDAVHQGIEQIRSGQRSVLGISLKAEKGLGKSHIVSRLRGQLKEQGESFFVYMSETDYSDLDHINSQFLNTLAYSLKQLGSKGVMQWQELATLLVSEAYKTNYSPQHIINQFAGTLAKRPDLIEQITAKICQLKSDIKDPYVVQAILWTLSPEKNLFAINWLAGREITQRQADAMGLPVTKDEDREIRALSLAGQVLDLIGDYCTIVICFDETEPKNTNSRGLTTPQVIALLAKDLYSKIKRGVLMVAFHPQTWTHQVRAMPQAEAILDRIGEKTFELQYLNSDDVVLLVSTWLQQFYMGKGLMPPHATYPFDESELRELGKERPIVRHILKWCRDNWKIPDEANLTLPDDSTLPAENRLYQDELHEIEVAFQEQMLALDGNLDDYLEDSRLIADALYLGFVSLIGQKVGQVSIEEVEEIEAKAADRGYLNFRVIGQDNGSFTNIGICVLQESGAKYVSAALKRLIDYDKFDLTRGCLVRSKAVKPNTHGHHHLETLLSKLGGEWVALKGKDLQPLLAIWFVFCASEEYELDEERIIEFIQHRKIAETNYLICEILSDPSGEVPDNTIDEDQFIASEALFVSANQISEADVLFN